MYDQRAVFVYQLPVDVFIFIEINIHGVQLVVEDGHNRQDLTPQKIVLAILELRVPW